MISSLLGMNMRLFCVITAAWKGVISIKSVIIITYMLPTEAGLLLKLFFDHGMFLVHMRSANPCSCTDKIIFTREH